MGKTYRLHSNPLKALKKAARDDFGFEPPRISKNKKKYSRSREKHSWKTEEDFFSFNHARA